MIVKRFELMTVDTDCDTIDTTDILLSNSDKNILTSILWCRDGLFRLVPIPVVVNAINTWNDYMKSFHELSPQTRLHIRWEQGVDVDPKIARVLLGEQGD